MTVNGTHLTEQLFAGPDCTGTIVLYYSVPLTSCQSASLGHCDSDGNENLQVISYGIAITSTSSGGSSGSGGTGSSRSGGSNGPGGSNGSNGSSDDTNAGLIAGLTIAVIALVSAVVVAVVWKRRQSVKVRKNEGPPTSDMFVSNPAHSRTE